MKCFTVGIPVHVLEYMLDKEDVHERNVPLLEHEESGMKVRFWLSNRKKSLRKLKNKL